jgi:homoserine dehydrogenase
VSDVKIGVIGFGTVGAGVVSCLLRNGDVIAKRAGLSLALARVADVDTTRDRGVAVPPGVLINDARKLIRESDIVVELVGGTTIAKDFILDAISQGKPVVTANKALLAEHGAEIFAAAEKAGVDVCYEASVAGGIPIIKALREGLVGNRIESIYGILNGTCNYILTRMEREGAGFDAVLKDAQRLGYAEAEPSLDIDGKDTAHKTAILASLAYGEWFGVKPVFIQGIRDISAGDIKHADELGYRIKLLGIIKKTGEDVQIRVHPTLIPKKRLLADISDVFNGVVVRGDTVGETLFYGRGAGRDATASAVVADITDIALNLKNGSRRRIPGFRSGAQFSGLTPMENIQSRYYIRLQVMDKPGVIARAASILAAENISISSFVQSEGQSADNVTLLILTHTAVEKNVTKAIAEIERMPEVRDKAKLLRIEDM